MSEGELAMSRLPESAGDREPADRRAVGDVEGQFIGGSDGGTSVFGDRSLTVSIKSYAKDTLCLRFHTQHLASSDKPTHYDAQIEHAYHLYAPNALQMPDANESLDHRRKADARRVRRPLPAKHLREPGRPGGRAARVRRRREVRCLLRSHVARAEVAVELCARRLPLQERRVGLPSTRGGSARRPRRADRSFAALSLLSCARGRRAEFAGSFTWPATDTLSAGVAVTTNPDGTPKSSPPNIGAY